ncbi:MAG: hypothetical protein ACQES2_08310 [Pseudomonadota bacterium]
MKKSFLYRWFGLGRLPRRLSPLVQTEGLLLLDEGITGWWSTRRINGPLRRYRYRKEGLIGSLVVTRRRFMAYSFSKRQINIGLDDERMSGLAVSAPSPKKLLIEFDASDFHPNWQGQIQWQFNTAKARQFLSILLESGAKPLASDDHVR